MPDHAAFATRTMSMPANLAALALVSPSPFPDLRSTGSSRCIATLIGARPIPAGWWRARTDLCFGPSMPNQVNGVEHNLAWTTETH